MKRIIHLAVISTLLASALTGATLELVPSSTTATVGTMFTIDVNISDVADLYAYQFDVGFDPALLNASTVTGGPFLATGGTTLFLAGTVDNSAGTVSSTAESLISLVPGVSGDGTLAQITFLAMGPGLATLTPFGVTLLDSSLAGIAATTPSVTISVVATPEVASGTYAISGLLMLTSMIAWRRRRY
jgi:adhesin HecA-like repeat protein